MTDMHFVDSSMIEAIGYDSENNELYIRFLTTGATYVYYGVEEWIFQEIMQADSKGIYFNTNVKTKYQYAKT